MFKNRKGFTMVELIVVIAVLAILAGIAIPIAGSLTKDANESSDAANVAMIQSAIEKQVAKTGDPYPTDVAGVMAAVKAYTKIKTIGTGADELLDIKVKAGATGETFIYDTSTNTVSVGTGTKAGNPFPISQ